MPQPVRERESSSRPPVVGGSGSHGRSSPVMPPEEKLLGRSAGCQGMEGDLRGMPRRNAGSHTVRSPTTQTG